MSTEPETETSEVRRDPRELVDVSSAWPLLRRFWGWVRPHRRYVWVTCVLFALATPVPLVPPLIIRTLIDDAIQEPTNIRLLLWGGILLGLTAVSALLGFATGYVATLFQAKVLRDIRLDLYLAMQRLSHRYFNNKETGYLLSRQIEDVSSLQALMADSLTSGGAEMARALGAALLILYLEWRLAVVGVVFVAVNLGLQYAVSGRLRTVSRVAREKWTEVSRALHQSLSGHTLIRAAAAERHEKRRFSGILHEGVRAQVKQDVTGLAIKQISGFVQSVWPRLILLVGIYLIVIGTFTVGSLFAFRMYLGILEQAFTRIAALNVNLQRSLASLERIYEVLDTEPGIASPRPGIRLEPLSGEVDLEDVRFSYEPGTPVLKGISLSVPPRTTVALVGPSGAGKTTLAHMLPRFFDPQQGRILIDGCNLRSLDLHWYRRRVGIVPQDIFLFDRSIAENIAYGSPNATLAEIEAAAESANAREFIDNMPDGLHTLIGERGMKLSGGQRQRIAIAREILRNPKILILDEATSSLDSETEALIQQALDVLLEGRTSFIIAHRLSTVTRADLIVVLENGEVVETGTHERLLDSDGLYARLYRYQFRDDPAEGRSASTIEL